MNRSSLVLALTLTLVMQGTDITAAYAAPDSRADARASLHRGTENDFKLDKCKSLMRQCLVENRENQAPCFAKTAQDGACHEHPIEGLMKKRAELFQHETVENLALHRCLAQFDASIGTWLITEDTSGLAAGSIDIANSPSELAAALQRCADLQ